MGAYSNPEILVDTQSGQHWRNLQESISKTTSNVIESIMENARKNKEFGQIAARNTKNLLNLTNDLDIKNPKLDIISACKPLVDEYEVLQNNIAFGKSKDVAADRAKCQKIELAIKKTTQQLADYSSFAENYKENIGSLGQVGGYSQYNDPNAMAFGGVATNNLKGKVELTFDPESYDPVLKAYRTVEEDGDLKGSQVLIAEVSSEKLASYLDNGGGLKVIPPATNILESLKNNPTIFDQKGLLNSDFTVSEERVSRQVSKDTITNNAKDKDIDIVYKKNYLKPDAEKVKAAINTNVSAAVAGLVASDEATTFYNHYVDPDNPVPLDSELTPEQQAKMKEWIGDAFIKTLPEIEDKNSPEKTEYVTRQTKVPSSGSKTKKEDKDKSIEEISKEIYSIDENSAHQDFAYGTSKVVWDSTIGEFYVKGNKDRVFDKKEDVIAYLKSGKKTPLTVKK